MKKEKMNLFNKNDVKSIFKVFSFVLVLALILELFSIGSFSKINALTYKNSFTKTFSFLSEPDNSLQIAAIGNSDLYSAFVPMQAFENHGYTSTVISSPHQTVLESYGYLIELLKKQSPKVLVIETDMLFENAPEFNADKNQPGKFTKMKIRAASFFSNLDSERFDDLVESHFSIFTFHDKWKNLKREDLNFSSNKEKFVTCDHGYNFNDSVKPAPPNIDMNPVDVFEPIPENDIVYLNKIIKKCSENDIKLVLVEMPSQFSWSYARHNAVQQFADANGLEFIDFNLMFEELQLDINKDFRDGGEHLNYFGASKTTIYLTDFISKRYGSLLIDCRNDPDFQYWAESNDEFREKYKINELLEKRRLGLK